MVGGAGLVGRLTFTIGNTPGLGMADFMLGIVSQNRQANPNPLNLAQNFVGLYAQDTWKVTNKLTLNYGVNWDPFLGMAFQQGDVYNFSLANYYAGTTSKAVSGAPPGFTFPGDPGFPGKSGINSQYGHFDPRIGLAWDPIRRRQDRHSHGRAASPTISSSRILNLNTSSSLPFRLTTVTSPAFYSLSNPWPQGDPFPYSYNPKNPVWPTTADGSLPGQHLPSGIPAHSVEHEDARGVFLEPRQCSGKSRRVGSPRRPTLGNHIIHVWNAVELNPAEYIPGNCAAGQYGLTAAGPCTQHHDART